MRRMMGSPPPPAGNCTTTLTGFVGYWAPAGAASRASATIAANAASILCVMVFSSFKCMGNDTSTAVEAVPASSEDAEDQARRHRRADFPARPQALRAFPFWGSTAPRLPFEKSYSALIVFPFLSRCATCRNQAVLVVALGIPHFFNPFNPACFMILFRASGANDCGPDDHGRL